MGRGTRAWTQGGQLDASALLARARLSAEEVAGACTPSRIARAIRAELWYGTLEGARSQARLGASCLVRSSQPWQSPALLYLGMDRDGARSVALQSLPAIIREAVLILAEIDVRGTRSPIDGVTPLLELVDVLGPVSWMAPAPALHEIVVATEQRAEHLRRAAAAGDDALAATAAHEAALRLQNWPRVSVDPAATAVLLASYAAAVNASANWDERPRLELLMVLDCAPGASEVALDHLPASLDGRSWSGPG